MTPSIQQLVCLFTIMTVVCTGLASALHVEIHPEAVNELITDTVTVTCKANDSPYLTLRVILVELGKKGQHPFANLRKTGIQVESGIKPNVKADGNINEVNRTESYLRVTIQNPSVEDGGVYSCLVFYLDVDGELKEGRAEANMTVDNNNDKLVINHLLKKVSKLEKIAERQEEELQEQTELLKAEHEQTELLKEQANKQDDQINQLKEQTNKQDEQAKKQDEQAKKQDVQIQQLKEQAKKQINQLKEQAKQQDEQTKRQQATVSSKLDELMATDRNQTSVIEALTDKDSFTCAFRAGYDPKDKLVDGNTLVFSVPILDVGNDYNTTTGIFTAPKKGLYVFDLSVRTAGSGWIAYVDLKANRVTVASVYAYDSNSPAQSSVTPVVSLQAGDQVRPVVRRINGNYLDSGHRHTIFSGFLLKMT